MGPMGDMEPPRSGGKRSSSDGRRRGGAYPVGSEVEVQSDDDGFRGAWYEATVVDHAPHKRFLEVVYTSLVDDRDPSQPLRESVRRSNVRPRPPHQLHPAAYYLHDLIEAFHNDGWWAGVISAVFHGLDDSRYRVAFPTSREEEMFEASLIRPQLKWGEGRWLPVYAPGADEHLFPVGAHIEVSRDREDCGAAWFDATVVKVLSCSAFLVEYTNLKAENSRELLMEIVDDQYIRSYRRNGVEVKDFDIDDDVEVLHHGGWAAGNISKICDGAKYVVKMAYNEKERQFSHDEMRHVQIWNGKKWVLKILKKMDKSPASSAADKLNSQIGKRYRLPTSVSPRDEPDSIKLSSLRKKTVVRCKSSKTCKTMKKMKLLERCKRQAQPCTSLHESPTTPIMETSLCPGMLMLENGSSVELHHCEGSSYMEIADVPIFSTVIPPNTLPNLLLAHQVCDINDATKLAKRDEGPEDIYDKGSDCQSNGAQETGSAVTIEADGFDRLSDLMHENGHGSRVSFTKKRSKRVVRAPEYMKKSLIQQALDESERRPIEEPSLRCLSSICWSSTIKCLLVNSSQDVTLSSFHTPNSDLTIDNGRVCITDQIIASVAGENHVESNTNKAPDKGSNIYDDESALVDVSHKELPIEEILLPFSKTSPIWESIESMEVFHKMPQRPHFLPLEQYAMEFREGMAIGLMISFANLVNSVQVLCADDAPASLVERMGALSPLEANGFNVDSLRAHLKGMLEIQANLKQWETRKASLKEKILEKKNDSERLGSLITEFDKAIEELEQTLASFRKRKDEVRAQMHNDNAEISKLEAEMLEAEKIYNSAAENFKIALSGPPWK